MNEQISSLSDSLRFQIECEKQKATDHIADRYWGRGENHWGSQRNIGHDELAAAELAKGALLDPEAYSDPVLYGKDVLAKLEKLMNSYRRSFHDPDGMGIGTFYDIRRFWLGLLKQAQIEIEEHSAKTWPEVDRRKGKTNKFNHEFDSDIRDSMFYVEAQLREGNVLRALDYAQLHFVQLSLQLFLMIDEVDDAELLLVGHRFKAIQSLSMRALEKGEYFGAEHKPLQVMYRFLGGAQSLTTVVDRFRRPVFGGKQPKKTALPFSLFELSVDEESKAEHAEPTAGPVLDPFRSMMQRLNQLVDAHASQFIRSMYPSITEFMPKGDRQTWLLQYITLWNLDERFKHIEGSDFIIRFDIFHRKEGYFVSSLGCGSDLEVNRDVDDFLAAMQHASLSGTDKSGGDLQNLRLSLSETLLFQLPKYEMELSSETMIVVPDGPLAALPFGSLLDEDGNCILVKCSIMIARDLHSVGARMDYRKVLFDQGFVMGDPLFGERSGENTGSKANRYVKLPTALDECARIAAIAGLALYTGEDANAACFRAEAPSANIIHLVTHGDYSEPEVVMTMMDTLREPNKFHQLYASLLLRSKIALAGAGGSDSESDCFITGADIAQLNLSKAGLVFLSLCSGSAGLTMGAEVSLGLSRSLLKAGAGLVVASPLSIEDSVGHRLAIKFYEYLETKCDAATALRRAQLSLAVEGEPWFRWCSFQVVS